MNKRLISTVIFILLIMTSISTAFAATTVSGTIQYIDLKNNSVTVLDFQNNIHRAYIDKNTDILTEGKESGLKDLYFGQYVEVSLSGNRALKINASLQIEPDRQGYIVPGSRFRRGEVFSIDNKSIEIKGERGREKYALTSSTEVYKKGEETGLSRIKEGDKVLLTFDDIYSSNVSQISIEDEEKHIEGVLKGKIEFLDENKKDIQLNEVSIYNNGKWDKNSSYSLKLKIQNDEIYYKGEKISLKSLKAKGKKEVYIAFEKSFGEMTASKLLVKEGSSFQYTDKIKSIEYGTGRMVVDNNSLYFNQGTIAIKDNRLIDPLNMNRGQDVSLYGEFSSGNKLTSLVFVQGTGILNDRADDTKILVYRGKIEDIYDYQVKIGNINYRLDYMLLDDNRWKEMSEGERFTVTEDTYIYDSDLRLTVPTDGFISSRYIDLNDVEDKTLRDRIKNNFYKGKIAYFVVKESPYGKEVLGMNITPQLSQYRQNVTLDYSSIGEIKDVDYDNNTIEITKMKNYNTLNNQWESTSDESISLNKTLILFNDKPLKNDELYKLSEKNTVYIIRNKSTSQDGVYVLLVED